MRALRITLFFLFAGLTFSVAAEVSTKNVPAGAVWYFHADFAAMRTGDAGRALFDWLDGEVFEEIRDDSGVDLSKEANQITAFAQQGTGIVIIIDGDISQESQDKMLALATLSGEQRTQKSGGKEYYFVSDGDDHDVENEHVRVSLDIDSLEDSAFVSLALKNKVIVTSSEDTMHALLDSNGAPKISSSEEGALFVLSADRNLMQAGMLADEFDYDEDWNSNIFKNAKQVALLVADAGDKLAFRARLVTTEPEMASSLASIARGLISLQVFSDDLDNDLKNVLSSTTVDVQGNALEIQVDLDPDVVIANLDN